MTNHEHQRALDLIMRRDVEGIDGSEAAWLESHLTSCAECSSYAVSLRAAGQAFRSMPVMASHGLVTTTQARLRARALEIRERESRLFLIGVSFCLGVLSSTASAWLWWRFGGWVAEQVGLPQAIVGPGVLLFWLLPAIVIAVLVTFVPRTVFNNPLLLALAREREGEIR